MILKEELIRRITRLKIAHYICDDSFHSCPLGEETNRDDQNKGECYCGASAHNAAIVKLIADIESD